MKNKHLKSLNLFIETAKFYKFGGEGGRGEGVVGVDYFFYREFVTYFMFTKFLVTFRKLQLFLKYFSIRAFLY